MNFTKHAACAAVSLLSCGCAQQPVQPQQPQPLTCTVERRDIVEECIEEGWLEPARSFILSPEVETRLLEVCVSEGEEVKAGRVLLKFDSSEISARIRLAELETASLDRQLALLRERRAGAELREAERNAEKAALDLREAEREAETAAKLFASSLLSKRELETAKSRLAVAKAQKDIADRALAEISTGAVSPQILELELKLEHLAFELSNLRKQLEKCEPAAPFDGTVVMLDRQLKNAYIPEGGMRYFPENGIAMIVADIDTMRVNSVFYERNISRLKTGQPVAVTARHAPGEEFAGLVTAIGMQGKRHGQTAVVPVEISVPNPGHKLIPGLTTEARVRIAEKKAVPAIPAAFVHFSEEKGHFVLRLHGRRKVETPVELGISDGEYVELLSGPAMGETLVAE